MRAGKKTEAEIGKTRPCIVYVKNLKESEATDIINSSTTTTSGKQTKTLRIATRRTIKEQELDQLVELETTRTTRTSKRVTTVTNVEPIKSKIVSSPRTRNTKAEQTVLGPKAAAKPAKQPVKPVATPLTNRRNTAVTLPVVQPYTPLNKRRDTLTQSPAQSQTQPQQETETEPEPQQPIVSESKAKMYKQSKVAATAVATSPAPPPTIAASRSRRSIKPNPKYASDDMVTPKYMGVLGNENPSKRTVKHLFADDDDDEEDEDLRDLIEEDNDDELTDAAFNPQLHKSDDDDDISERDFEQQLRREKVLPKRGRGRPPKSASAASSASNNNNSSGQSQAGRGGATQLQQLRRTMTPNLSRSHVKMMSSSPSVGNKRKLEEHNDAPIARKRMNTSDWPVINGSTSMTKTSSLTLAKPKVASGASNATGGGSLRMLQSSKPRPTSTFKMTTATAGNVRQTGSGQVMRTGTVGRPPGSTNTLKVQKASAANAAAIKAAESDDVPTFTIVNIDDIINQDDVLISRSSSHSNGSSKKLHAVARSNNTSRTTQTTSSTPTTAISNRHIGGTPGANASHKRLKTTTGSGMGMGTGAAAKHPLAINHNKQTSLVVSVGQAKPRPRILNAEMGKKTQPMTKPLMSMSKELCPMTDGDDNTEDEDMANELTEDDITLSPPPAAANQQRLVRRVQTTNPKWLPNRRHVLSAAASSNNQRQQQQQHHQQQQQHHNQQQQQQHHHQQQDRKLTKLLGENSDDDVFKKPASPSTSTPALRRYKEHAAADEDTTSTDPEPEITKQQPKYFPPETTTYCEEDGRIVKKITCYETWHVISTPKEPSNKTRQQRTCLELALVKLANMASRIKVPSSKWTSKVTLYKLSPSLMQRQTMTVFTGDLKSYNIPEEERHKYQPSCVLFRRSVLDRSKCRVPFDRAIIFKNKCFYANIEGKHVNLLGAPEVVNSVKDVEILIDIVDSLALSSNLVETVTSK